MQLTLFMQLTLCICTQTHDHHSMGVPFVCPSIQKHAKHARSSEEGLQNFSNKELCKCEQTDLGLSTIQFTLSCCCRAPFCFTTAATSCLLIMAAASHALLSTSYSDCTMSFKLLSSVFLLCYMAKTATIKIDMQRQLVLQADDGQEARSCC